MVVRDKLHDGIPVRAMGLSDDDRSVLKPLCLLTAKPTLYIANVAEDGFQNNPYLDQVESAAAGEGAAVVRSVRRSRQNWPVSIMTTGRNIFLNWDCSNRD